MGERLMSQKEAQRYAVVQRLVASEMSQAQAFAPSRRSSNRRIAPLEREQFVALVRQHYADFGLELAREYLARDHGFVYSREAPRLDNRSRAVEDPPSARAIAAPAWASWCRSRQPPRLVRGPC